MLVVTLYEDDEGEDRFKVFLVEGEEAEGVDVTEHYDVFASTLDDGRVCWSVAEKV